MAPNFESGYHRFAFVFVVAAAAAWFYAFNEWWGFFYAALLCVPVGLASTFLFLMLIGTLRQITGVRDSLLTWILIFGGLPIAIYGVVALDGPSRALVVLAGGSLVLGGVTLLKLRMNAMEYRYDRGELDEDNARFVEGIRDFRSQKPP